MNRNWEARMKSMPHCNSDQKLPQPTLIAPMAGNYDMTGAMSASMMTRLPKTGVDDRSVTTGLLTLQSKSALLMFAAQASATISDIGLERLVENQTQTLPWLA